jgi:cytochrome c peroxidase
LFLAEKWLLGWNQTVHMRGLRLLHTVRIWSGGATAAAFGLLALVALSQGAISQAREPIEPLPLAVPVDLARAELGEQLFRDVRLSHGKDRSCETCHPLNGKGMDGKARASAYHNNRVLRNTPTIFNVGFDLFFTWDGKFETLSDLNDKVLQDAALMEMTWPQLLSELNADPKYVALFKEIYPEGVSKESVIDALDSFETSLITPNARFDKFLRGEKNALSSDELEGYQLFKSYGCVACHQGINVGGNLFQTFGVFSNMVPKPSSPVYPDLGRYELTNDDRDKGVFRVPSLRNVAVTAPYFHDGRAATLQGAVDTMARAQLGRVLSSKENYLIVQFLGSLTGEFRGQPLQVKGRSAR